MGVYQLKGQLAPLSVGIGVAVDVASLFAKGFVYDVTADRQGAKALQERMYQLAVSFREDREQDLNVIYPSQSIYRPSIFQAAANIKSTKAKGGAMCVGATRYLLRLLASEFPSTNNFGIPIVDRQQLDELLHAWIDDYNLNRTREGFPTFGLTPDQCQSQIKAPPNLYRALPFHVL